MSAFSLHRRDSSPYWFVAFRVPDPENPGTFRQCTRSTKQEKKSEAERSARAIVDAAHAEAGAGTRNGRAIYALLQGAAKLAEAGKLNVATGREILAQMIEAGGGGEFKRYTVRAWLAEWLAGKTEETAKPGRKGRARGYSPATYTRYSGVVNQFLDGIPEEKANGDILALTADDIRRWRDALRAEGRSAATVNDAVKTIRTALTAARKNGVVLSNVAEAVTMLAEADPIRATFTPGQVRRLLVSATGDWPGVILFGWFTGASLRDITDLRWRQVDLANGTLSYARRKTGTGVVVPLHPELVEWLMARPSADDPESRLFPTLAGKSPGGKSGLSMAFAKIMDAAGIKAPEEAAEGEAGRKRKALSFHSLRHSFVSTLANAGIGVELRQALAGHASAEMNLSYTLREVASLRGAVKKIPGLREEEGMQAKRRKR
jgi:integrase